MSSPYLSSPIDGPISSLWGHPAGAGATPADAAFINQVARFMTPARRKAPRR